MGGTLFQAFLGHPFASSLHYWPTEEKQLDEAVICCVWLVEISHPHFCKLGKTKPSTKQSSAYNPQQLKWKIKQFENCSVLLLLQKTGHWLCSNLTPSWASGLHLKQLFPTCKGSGVIGAERKIHPVHKQQHYSSIAFSTSDYGF